MSSRHSYPHQQQAQQQQNRGGEANGEAPGSPPSALSFLHGLSEEPMHGDPAGGVDSMAVQEAGPDVTGLSARCADRCRASHGSSLPDCRCLRLCKRQCATRDLSSAPCETTPTVGMYGTAELWLNLNFRHFKHAYTL